ncbi:MAG TPA: endonuclease MutS2, partial [Cytophagales bacterium]|nr:endonuclease MutS2 [Cytophagales bacterium]
EPAEVLDINNEIRELESAERREIVRILTALTDTLRPHVEGLKASYRFLGRIDFIRAKGKLAVDLDAVAPEFVKAPLVEWYRATHPILLQTHRASGKPVVPLSLRMDQERRIILISGPNAGGKSVAMKTVGLLQYMWQCGLLIPVSEASKVGLFQDIFLDIGDEQSLENDLSTYSSHLTHMRKVITLANKKSLFLIDEFGSGTEPQYGGALAEAILETLHKAKAFGVVTTHYTNLKQFAEQNEGVVNAAMRYDVEALEPLYILEVGKPGSSFALEIARKIGLPKPVLDSATDKVGATHVKVDQTLSQLEKEKKRFESFNEALSTRESRASKAAERYENLADSLEEEKRKIINAAKAEAKRLIQEANANIERTIREIKEAQAEKEATKEARQKLAAEAESLEPEAAQPPKKKRRKSAPKPEVVDDGPIKLGDSVRIKGQTAVGEVLAIRGKDAEIQIGLLKSTLKLNRLEKISRREARKEEKAVATRVSGFNINEKRAEFSPNLDLRGQRASEALSLVDQFLDEALLHSMSELRILHGKGDGILRDLVRNTLRKTKFVDRFEDEHADRGGAGVTIVHLH